MNNLAICLHKMRQILENKQEIIAYGKISINCEVIIFKG